MWLYVVNKNCILAMLTEWWIADLYPGICILHSGEQLRSDFYQNKSLIALVFSNSWLLGSVGCNHFFLVILGQLCVFTLCRVYTKVDTGRQFDGESKGS